MSESKSTPPRYCPYCHCGQGAADAQRASSFHRDRRQRRSRDARSKMIERANGRMHRAADFHRRDPCRRLRRSLCARARRASSIRCCAGASEGQTGHEHGKACDLHGRPGADALGPSTRGQSRRRRDADRAGQERRRRLRADAGDDQHHGDQARAAVRRDRRRRSSDREPRRLPRAGAQASASISTSGRSPIKVSPDKAANRSFLIDRAGRDRRALRQDPHVRRRSRQRRELSRIAQLPARRTRRCSPICRGAGSA